MVFSHWNKCPQISDFSGSEPPAKIFHDFLTHFLSSQAKWLRFQRDGSDPQKSAGAQSIFRINIPPCIYCRYSENVHRPERTFIFLFFCLTMFYMAFDLRYSISFIYSTPISSGSVHLSMHPSIYYRTVAVLHQAHKHRRTYTRTHPHTYPHCMSCMHTSSTFHVLLPNMHECKLRTQLSITRHEIVSCTDKQRRSHRRVLGGVFDDIWCIIVICKCVNVQDTRERLPHLNIQKHA